MDFVDLALHPRKANQRFSPFRNALPEAYEQKLSYRFGDRATVDPNELLLYSRDVAAVPWALDLALKRNAWAVVRPTRKGDLVDVLQFAHENFLPVVPRGAGTSGYGGAVPTEGGIVVDMRGFDRVLDVDAEARTVTVEPGVILWHLEERLREEGLALRQYPTSATGSTVGGMVATTQGGGGVGSLKYGPFENDILEVQIITPEGELTVFTGDELDLVQGAWGITGFIVGVTLRVREHASAVPFLGAFADLEEAAHAARRIAQEADAWHMALNTPEYANLVNEAADENLLPKNKHSVLVVLEGGEDAHNVEKVKGILNSAGGKLQPDAKAQTAWDARFDHLNVKRLGPSVLVSEAAVAIEDVAEAVRRVNRAVRAEVHCTWAIAINPGEFDLIFYGLEDERRPEYPTALGNSLAMLDAVKKVGGRSYNTGVLLATESKDVLGKERVKRLKAYKKETDKEELFNPGPVLGARMRGVPFPMFNFMMRTNAPLIKMARGQFTYAGGKKQDPSFKAMNRAIGAVNAGPLTEVDYEVNTCIFCGWCNAVAPEGPTAEWESEQPRGRVILAKNALAGKTELTPEMQRNIARAPLSVHTDAVCPTKIPINRATDLLLATCAEQLGPLPEHAVLASNVEATGNVFGRKSEERIKWTEAGYPFDTEARMVLFGDDVASFEAPEVLAFTARAVMNAGVALNYLGPAERHSGASLVETGQRDAARESLEDVLDALVKRRAEVIITPDANAVRAIRLDWPIFAKELGMEWTADVLHSGVALAKYVKEGKLNLTEGEYAKKVALHAPEALEPGEREQIRELLESVPGVEVVELPHHDCGHGRAMRETYPDLYEDLATQCAQAAEAAGAEVIVTASPGCFVAVQAGVKAAKADVEVATIEDLVASTMEVVEGGGAAVPEGPIDFGEEEEEKFVEHDIPEGEFRVELVKEKMAIPVAPDEIILDKAEEYGLELPFSCRAGNCDTCSARWEGEAPEQDLAEALDADEQKEFVLTCIAKPKGPIKLWTDEAPGR